MKNKIVALLILSLFLLIPKNVYAQVIELTQEDFDNARGEWIDDYYDEEIQGYVEGHYEGGVSSNGVEYRYDSNYGNYHYYLQSGSYKLSENIGISEKIIIDNSIVDLDLNTYDIFSSSDGTFTLNNSEFNIHGNGNITTGIDVAMYVSNSTIVIDDATIQGLYTNNSNVTINGGNFGGFLVSYSSNDDKSVIINGGFFGNALALAIDGSSDVIINNGEFLGSLYGLIIGPLGDNNNEEKNSNFTINGGIFLGIISGLAAQDNSSIILNGGKYYSGLDELISYIKMYHPEEYSEESEADMRQQISELFGGQEINGAIAVVSTVEKDFKDYLGEKCIYSNELIYKSNDEINTGILNIQQTISIQNYIEVIKDYEVVEGDNQTYSHGKDLVIKLDGDANLFKKLLIDGKEVNKKYYTVESGSTIITLKSEYIDNIKAGQHELTFVYSNTTVKTNVTVSNNPQTFDNIYTYILMLISSIIMLVINKKVFE